MAHKKKRVAKPEVKEPRPIPIPPDAVQTLRQMAAGIEQVDMGVRLALGVPAGWRTDVASGLYVPPPADKDIGAEQKKP